MRDPSTKRRSQQVYLKVVTTLVYHSVNCRCQSVSRWAFASFASEDLHRRISKGKAPMSNIATQSLPSDETQPRMWLDLVCTWLIPSQNSIQVPIEVAILATCIMDHTHINVGEIIADQFRRKAKQQATSLPYPSLVSILCPQALCPLFLSADKSVRAESVITLDTKTDKDASASKQPRGMEDKIQPPPSMLSSITNGLSQVVVGTASTPNDLLKIEQMAQAHES
ncbi:hypothetical protein HAX54_015916 [Datura stramonium]|uniref:Putative plant transposon protein domain-containing protein n=1 Tax=Datura stramonium TaxID=4076 RepID=A0ABS8UJQ5_DATST|nr:hypothetical protein [Datura stramonium]